MRKWIDKPYHSLDYYLKNRFGEKIYKIALDGGMTCPNRDGTLDTRGCIFCSAGGSGDFASPLSDSVTTQIDNAIEGIRAAKVTGNKFIAYFQSYTNTYAPVSYLEKIFTEAMRHPSIVGLSIGTRPDCLGEDVLALLTRLNNYKPVWVELGLQTIHEETARFIRRGYSLPVFEQAFQALKERQIETIVHIIIGLPGEGMNELSETISYLGSLPVWGIKLQLLHVLKGTDLAKELGQFPILTMEEYIDRVLYCIEHLPPETVIHRITGDGPKKLLLAPAWSANKKQVMNAIHKAMKERDSWQGKAFIPK